MKTNRRAAAWLAPIAALVLLSACTVPGHGARATQPITPGGGIDPCSLLTAEQAKALELKPSHKYQPPDPELRLPQGCMWSATDSTEGHVSTVSANRRSLATYLQSTEPSDTIELGGLMWQRYGSGILGEASCDLYLPLGERAFVSVASTDTTDPSDTCDRAKQAAVIVASHLPGGDKTPQLPKKEAPPPNPLEGLEPCASLNPEQLTQLGVSATGRKTGKGRSPNSMTDPGCEWDQKDKNRRILYLSYRYKKPDDEWYPQALEWQQTGTLATGGRTWKEYAGVDGNEAQCILFLPIAPTAAAKITGGNNADPAKACDQIREAAKMVTPKLPKG